MFKRHHRVSQNKQTEALFKVSRSFIEITKEKYKKVRVCRPWGIHSKSICKKHKEEFMGHYYKKSDNEIIELIRPIILARPTYGYKRVKVILNRQRGELGLKTYNKKKIYPIMKLKEGNFAEVRTNKRASTNWCSHDSSLKYSLVL